MPKLPHQLIPRARAGKPEDLDELSGLLTTENYTLAALDAALGRLDPKGFPIHLPRITDRSSFLDRIIAVLNVVSSSFSRCCRTPELKAATSSRLQAHLDGLLSGMSLILKHVGTRFVYRLVEDTLFDMTFLDDELSSLVYSSSQAVILILKLWQYKPNIPDETSDYLNGRLVPYSSALVNNCLIHLEGEQTFGDIILSSRRRLSTFLDVLLFKLKRLGNLVEPVTRKGGLLHEHVELLTVSFIKLQRRVTSLREKQSLCLHEMAVITSLLAPPLTPKDWFLDNWVLILRTAGATRNLTAILNSGLIEAVVTAFPSCNWKGEAQIHQGKHILALLASSACYPRVLKAETRPVTRGDFQGSMITALELILDWNGEKMPSLLLRPKRSILRVVEGKGATNLEYVKWHP
ncbi:hypothetical protein BKA70DRAFT_1225442 [Coprinopsis sp. MPI-PUGE-AT-0042]|nr:hypothetical protein BKA70DRAFT_1225442 [Coprinopsis sp. MPI-PUGE-AT-0042]